MRLLFIELGLASGLAITEMPQRNLYRERNVIGAAVSVAKLIAEHGANLRR
jgi:hypothetical protein